MSLWGTITGIGVATNCPTRKRISELLGDIKLNNFQWSLAERGGSYIFFVSSKDIREVYRRLKKDGWDVW